MASYDYYCPVCRRNFEIIKPMTDAAKPAACPSCHASGRRIFSAPGIAIKGAAIKFKDSECAGGPEACQGCSQGACDFD